VTAVASSHGSKRVGVCLPSPKERNRSRFQNVVSYSQLEFRIMDTVQINQSENVLFKQCQNFKMREDYMVGHIISERSMKNVGFGQKP
jgi:hypothetical protein